jgi:hypothetical protein|tara:strand:- start:7635 stop:8066 length:432 start_codon:yes stop_codon:yes gene_type:complete
MASYVIKPYQAAHADAILKYGEYEDYGGSYPTHALETEDAWTGFYNNEPIVCGGITPIWEHVAEVWIIMKQETNQHKFFMLKNIKDKFETTIQKREYHRIQAAVRTDFKNGIRFAKWFGMTSEGVMQKYGPEGKDYLMTARII